MDREDAKRKLTKPLEILGRYKYVLLVVALGAALLALPGSRKPGGSSPDSALPEAGSAAPAGRENLADTERAMEEILSKISGVGRVDVMLTLHSGGELVLAQAPPRTRTPTSARRTPCPAQAAWWSRRRSIPCTVGRWWCARGAAATACGSRWWRRWPL